MARIKVVDPHSGATLTVEEDSPQAKLWGEAVKVEPAKDKPVRTKKAE